MPNVEKGGIKSFEQMSPKEQRRWALRQFHPDLAGSYENTSSDPSIDAVLSTLSRSDTLESWPKEYSDFEIHPRFVAPGHGPVESRTYFLPSTPEEFVYSLWLFKKNGSYDVFLTEAPKHFIVEGGRAAFEIDDSLAAVRESIRSAADLSSLIRLFEVTDILSVYSPDELLGIADHSHQNMLALINARALEIMESMASRGALTEQIVNEFPFYKFKSIDADNPELEWDTDSRQRALLLASKKEPTLLQESRKSLAKELAAKIRTANGLKSLDELETLLDTDPRLLKLKQRNLFKALIRFKKKDLTK
jgi:hypothetical protein